MRNDTEVLVLTCLSCSSISLLMKIKENFIVVKKLSLEYCIHSQSYSPHVAKSLSPKNSAAPFNMPSFGVPTACKDSLLTEV